MRMLLGEGKRRYKYTGYLEGSLELHHEDVGFIGSELLVDRELIDLDGSETHLSHQMGEQMLPEMQARRLRKPVRRPRKQRPRRQRAR